MPKTNDSGGRHGWNALDNYLHVHERRIADLCDEGFLLEPNLTLRWHSADTFVIEGRLHCQHSLFVDVQKFLEVRERRGRVEARTVSYSYHAGVKGSEDRAIFRYDNAHQYAQEGHPDDHHKHQFDHQTWRELRPPLWTGMHFGAGDWPHLDEVVKELRNWWEAEGRSLGLE